MKATATCSHGEPRWNEQTYQQDSETQKMTRVTTGVTYAGDEWQGTSQVDYLMAYTPAGPVYYLGLERFEGTLGGKKGSFVLQHAGVYKEDAQTGYEVVPGSATGELAGLKGRGGYTAGHQSEWPAELEYDFE